MNTSVLNQSSLEISTSQAITCSGTIQLSSSGSFEIDWTDNYIYVGIGTHTNWDATNTTISITQII